MTVADALRRAGLRDVDDSLRARTEHSGDASNYRVLPLVVARPRDADEVAAVVAVARDEGVPITPRGGGTSIAGNAVGAGILLDLSRHLTAIEIDPATRTATVEPGVILDAIASPGLRFGPDPSSHARATIGGAIGNNACGARALRYGRTSDNVLSLDLLTASGAVITDVPDALTHIVRRSLGAIRTECGRFSRQVSGYALEHLLPENDPSLARFVVGSEGSLGIVTSAVVRLVETPAATVLVVLAYPDMAAAADAVPGLEREHLVALEGMDERLVGVVRARGRAVVPDLPRGGGWLFAEVAGADAGDARAYAARIVRQAGAVDARVYEGPAARAIWRVREDGAGLGSRTPDDRPAWPGWEDSAVPPARLGPYLRDLRALLDEHHLDGLMYGHFGDGCVHARLDLPLDRPTAYRAFVEAAADLVVSYGGSLSGEHGDGRARSALLARMVSPEILRTYAAVKHVFDPDGLMNPGVIVDPAPLTTDLRVPVLAGPLAGAHRCVGMGTCRADSGGVMCPSYQATRDEKDSTRGRARVLQDVAAGHLAIDGPEVRESLELCLSCKGCASDCPTGVDVAALKSEVLHEAYRRRLRPASHYALGWLPLWSRLAPPPIANALAPRLKRLGGVDPRRPVPPLARRSFRSTVTKTSTAMPTESGGGRPVVLFADTFTDRFAPQVGLAAVEVLAAAGYAVTLSPPQACCGLTWTSTGQLGQARRRLARTLEALASAVAQGLPVVGLEPSCTAALRDDLPRLLPDDPRSAPTAAAVTTLAELLAGSVGWSPPDLSGLSVTAQPHCHHHAVMGWSPDAQLLQDAGAEVTRVAGCCGLAGDFGMTHHDMSVAVAETHLLPALRADPDAVVLADGFSCRTQIAQLTDRRAIHLAELLSPSWRRRR